MARKPTIFSWSRLTFAAPGARETFVGTAADLAAKLGVSPRAVNKARAAGRSVKWWRCDGPAPH